MGGDQSGRVAKRHELETRQKRTEAVAILDHGRKTNDRNVWWGVFNRASFFCAARAVPDSRKLCLSGRDSRRDPCPA
jgi:hypothetical protein